MRMARRRGLRSHDVEDAMQKVFIALLESIDRYDPAGGRFESWVMTIARRSIRDHIEVLRNRREQPEAADAVDTIDPGPDSEQRMEEAEAYAVFLALVNLLPDDLREVLIMADLEEVSMPQIAQELGISEQAGYARLRRARLRLQGAWQERQSAASPMFALGAFTLDEMIAKDRSGWAVDPQMKGRVWDRLVQALGPESSAGVAGPAGLAGAGVVKAAAAVVIFALGMAAGALLRGSPGEHPIATQRTSAVADVPSLGAPVVAAEGAASSTYAVNHQAPEPALVSSARVAAAALRSSTGAVSVPPAASAAESAMVAERAVIQEARAALRDHDPTKALDALRRHRASFKEPRFADVREDLWHQAMDMREAQPHP
jgi:RNA polymerase sigma-70 factor (ECF subfamily)